MLSICGVDCCASCSRKDACGGCVKTNGHPFGGNCVAAECIQKGGSEAFSGRKAALILEINALHIPNLVLEDLNLLNGFYVNLEYPLPNGQRVKLLQDSNVYWGSQVEIPNSGRCYGVVADTEYILVSEYGPNGTDPQIIVYKKR